MIWYVNNLVCRLDKYLSMRLFTIGQFTLCLHSIITQPPSLTVLYHLLVGLCRICLWSNFAFYTYSVLLVGVAVVMAMLCTCRVAVVVFIFMLLMWCASGASLGAVIVS